MATEIKAPAQPDCDFLWRCILLPPPGTNVAPDARSPRVQPAEDATKSEIRICEILQKHVNAEEDISLQDDMLAEIEVRTGLSGHRVPAADHSQQRPSKGLTIQCPAHGVRPAHAKWAVFVSGPPTGLESEGTRPLQLAMASPGVLILRYHLPGHPARCA